MMTRARKSIIDLESAPYYHCISRCIHHIHVAQDQFSGKNFEHRGNWIVE